MNPAFYTTGGNLPLDAPCYIARRADEDLYQAIRAGEFCYLLDTRQVGKSSLIVHATQRLKEAGVAVALVELTGLGITSTTVTQWYDALLAKIGAALDLEDDLDAFWFAHERLAPLPRFMEALRRVVLEGIERPVAIFLDEIDVVRSLPFPTDELFAGIRELYNRRTQDPVLERLSLCLIGVAQPTDLIQDPRITPFNIGRRIELTDFTPEEAAPLAQGLPGEPAQARRLLDRVLYWTGGHPYLTQCLCQAVAEDGQVTRPRGVDRVCEGLFFSVRARDQEKNLKFVAGQLLQPDLDRAALLDRYRQVRERRRLRDDPTDRLIGALRLAGIVRALEGLLWVRNRIYFRAFDHAWIEANLPDAEVRRQRAAYRRGLTRMGIAAGAVIAVLLGTLSFVYDRQYRHIVEHYTNMVKRLGSPEGVGPLSESEHRHRTVSFRFTRHGRANPVETVEAVDAADRCNPRNDVGTYFKAGNRWENTTDKVCRWEFVRDTKDQMVYEKAFNARGRLVWGFVYSPVVAGQPRRAHFVGPDGFPAPQLKSAAEIVELEYTEDGWEGRRRYFDRGHRSQPGADGAYGERIEYDTRGLPRRLYALDASGNPMIVKDRYSIGELDYDDRGNRIEARLFDTHGRPILHKEGWHRNIGRYDQYGNVIEGASFDDQERPTLDSSGCHKVTTIYDEHGNLIETACFDTEVKPILSQEGLHLSRMRYDDHGNQIEWAYFDTNGQPTLIKDGYHKATAHYDERDNQIKTAYFDTADRPITMPDGYHRLTARYDERGNQIEWVFFDTVGQPTKHKDGHHKKTARYDERGNQIETAYFDSADRPITMPDGYHRSTARYDERGNQIEWAYFDTKGQPTLIKDGYHKATAHYDERGNQIKTAYFDTADRPITMPDGYHRLTACYDERGNQIEWAYFDTNGQPTLIKDGYHKQIALYDERGNQIERAYFDTDRQATVDRDQRVHRTVWEYNKRGNRTREAYFGADGHPIQSRKDGVYSIMVSYNIRDQFTEVAGFDAGGQPMPGVSGFQRRTYAYDNLGRKVLEIGYRRDDGNSITAVHTRFDERGNEIEVAYFDMDGRPTLHKDGYHKQTARYDEHGHQVELAYFDIAGQPTLHAENGVHRTVWEYDDQGHQTKEAYFGIDDRPEQNRKSGAYSVTAKYDIEGRIAEVDVFGSKGQVRIKNDNQGRQIELAAFDSERQPMRTAEGYQRRTFAYDGDGRKIEQIDIGFDGREGYTSIRYRFDSQQRQIEEAFFGSDEKPAHVIERNPLGYTVRKKEYAPDGTEKVILLGFDQAVWGYETMIQETDHVQCLDRDGKLVQTQLVATVVMPGGQAERLGLHAGDVLTHYAGEVIAGDFLAFIKRRAAEPADGPPQVLRVWREGKEMSFTVKPGKLGLGLQDRGVAVAGTSKTRLSATTGKDRHQR